MPVVAAVCPVWNFQLGTGSAGLSVTGRLAWAHPKLDKNFKSHGGAKRWRAQPCQLRFLGFLVRLCERAKRQGAGPGVDSCHCKRREGGNPGVGGVWSIKSRSILKRTGSFFFLAFSSSESHTCSRGRTPNLRFEFLATCPSAILAAGSQRVPLYAPRPGWGEGVTFEARRGREVAHLGPNVRVFQGPLD